MAQTNSVSPYSRIGLGDYLPVSFSRNYALGGASMGLPQALNIDASNPASYQQIQFVTFEAGFEGSLLDQTQQNPDITVRNNRTGFRYVAAAVPVTNWWGSAVVFKPYSVKGYQISRTRTVPNTEVVVNDYFAGEGGLNIATWGNSFEVAEGLSLGVNANFIFGNAIDENLIDFRPTNFVDTRTITDVAYKAFTFDYGLQYQYALPGDYFLGTGLAYSNTGNMNATVESYQFTEDAFGALDTLSGGFSEERDISIPSEFKVGLSFGKNHPQILNPAWAVNADFEMYNGAEFVDFDGSAPLQNGYKVQVGGFFTPRFSVKSWERLPGYFNNIEYRLGAYYEKTPLMLAGQELPDYGITFGLGLPIKQRNIAPGEVKITLVNIGASFGQRGTLNNNLILEEYLSFYIGITFNDKWFIDYKYR